MIKRPVVSVFIGDCDENTGNCRALRTAVGSRHSRCRFLVLQKSVLGTADGEYRNCFGIRSFLLKILQASVRKVFVSLMMGRSLKSDDECEYDDLIIFRTHRILI